MAVAPLTLQWLHRNYDSPYREILFYEQAVAQEQHLCSVTVVHLRNEPPDGTTAGAMIERMVALMARRAEHLVWAQRHACTRPQASD